MNQMSRPAQQAPRIKLAIPVKIQADNGVFSACTLNVSSSGVQIQTPVELPKDTCVTLIRGAHQLRFRVVWIKRNALGARIGLECLNPPLPMSLGA